jgi:hypothetical protein
MDVDVVAPLFVGGSDLVVSPGIQGVFCLALKARAFKGVQNRVEILGSDEKVDITREPKPPVAENILGEGLALEDYEGNTSANFVNYGFKLSAVERLTCPVSLPK